MNGYERQGDTLCRLLPVVGHAEVLSLAADRIHEERTGVHARVAIRCQKIVLAWGTINVDRDEDRVRLANSAHKQISGATANGLAKDYPAGYLKKDLDDFCRGLWEAHVDAQVGEEMAGAAERVPLRFALTPYVLFGGGTIVFAQPGGGKSYTLMAMAVCIDAGRSHLWPVQQSKVLWINLERSRVSVEARLGNINEALGLPRTRALLTMNAKGRTLQDILPAARRTMEERGATVVFLDSISRAGMGDLTENNPVNRICDGLNALSHTWVAIGHTPRESAEHVYGGIHFDAAADVMVQLTSEQADDGPLGVALRITKDNDVGKRPPTFVRFDFNGDLGLQAIGPARPGEFPELEADRAMSLKDEVLSYLLEHGAASATTTAHALQRSRENVSRLLNRDPAFVRLGKAGREQQYGVAARRPPAASKEVPF